MADVATPPAGPEHKTKPERPDEEKYKSDLANAEKEHAVVQEKLVRCIPSTFFLLSVV